MSNALIFIDHDGVVAKKSSLPGITFGQAYVAASGGTLHLVIIGSGIDSVADDIKGYGADKIHVVDAPCFEAMLGESYVTALAEVQKACGATLIAGVSNSTTKDLLPRLSAKLDAGMASDVTAVIDAKTFERGMWAGNVTATVAITSDVKICTVMGAEFDGPELGNESNIENHSVTVSLADLKTSFIGIKKVKSERPDVTTAETVVSGGRGCGSAEGFALVEKLADLLGAGVGASRAVCDAGWVPNDLQIGQTGKVVAPNLYFAIGISGAIQHLAGMKNSKVIVAINKDPEAPIFQVADYGLVADLHQAVPEIIESIQ